MEVKTLLHNICDELELGTLRGFEVLSGGLMHKMFRMQTSNGDYAIKLLNPEVMKRPDVFKNYNLAEQLEDKLINAEIPVVAAVHFNNTKMQCSSGQYYYVFNYIDGKALKSEEIKAEHCRAIGRWLAKIHLIESRNENTTKVDMNIDWDYYIDLSKKQCVEISELLASNVSLIKTSQAEGNKAYKKLPSVSCISHGDMDSKNVLWSKGNPYIIDLESLSYGNPFVELFEMALCWSGYEHCDVNFDLLEQFVSSYLQEYGKIDVDWETLYYCNNGRLSWLEYNIKRSLMIECTDEEERLLGIEQAKETIEHMIYYDGIKNELLNRLSDLHK